MQWIVRAQSLVWIGQTVAELFQLKNACMLTGETKFLEFSKARDMRPQYFRYISWTIDIHMTASTWLESSYWDASDGVCPENFRSVFGDLMYFRFAGSTSVIADVTVPMSGYICSSIDLLPICRLLYILKTNISADISFERILNFSTLTLPRHMIAPLTTLQQLVIMTYYMRVYFESNRITRCKDILNQLSAYFVSFLNDCRCNRTNLCLFMCISLIWTSLSFAVSV